MRAKWVSRAAVASLFASAAFSAQASFHLMKVVEVFPGTAASPSAQYVVIQMFATGENFVGGHAITVFDSADTLVGTFTFAGNVANGSNQSKILIATSQAQAFFGVTADLTMTAALISAGGKVCWAGTLDCVAWGAYTGGTAGVGTPFNAATGLESGKAAIRRLDIAGSATVLDAGDDTDNSASDFIFGLPAPRNNAGVLGTVPAATCGNGALEGLEQCDDHNLVNGDGCSSTCQISAVAVHGVAGDFDGDGKSDVFWRNASTGSDVVWKSGNSATQQAAKAESPGWQVVGRGDFNGDRKADVFWRNVSTGANTIWKSGNAATTQAATGVTNLSWKVVGVGDFDGDGKSDVFWRNTSTGAETIWRSANAATQQATTGVTSQSWQVVGTGDFNGDGKSDVLWRNTSTGANAIWRSGNHATQQAITGVTSQSWKIVGIGDFDGDGKSDVFWRNTSTGANTIWKSGNSATLQAVAGVGSQSWRVVSTGDYNGDGKSDVFWRNTGSGANTIWRSASSATVQAVAGVANQSWNVVPYEGQALVAANPTLTIADVAVAEGNAGTTPATFTIRLSQPSTSPVTYSIATANGTATAGTDYVAGSLGGETIAAGATSRTFVVSINGDTATEPNETFNVDVSNVTGAVVGDGQARGTITNDDSPLLSIANVSVTEGDSGTRMATFTVQLSQAATVPVSYDIATANGTAMAGSDYEANSLTAETIPVGSSSRTFVVTINGDTVYEGNQTFTVNVTNVVGATVSDAQAIGTIVDDDNPYGY
jgi:cysteine-rich repeat protein